MTGTVSSLNLDGSGAITPDGGGAALAFSPSAVQNSTSITKQNPRTGLPTIEVSDSVLYELDNVHGPCSRVWKV
jgi:hypothetical protein